MGKIELTWETEGGYWGIQVSQLQGKLRSSWANWLWLNTGQGGSELHVDNSVITVLGELTKPSHNMHTGKQSE